MLWRFATGCDAHTWKLREDLNEHVVNLFDYTVQHHQPKKTRSRHILIQATGNGEQQNDYGMDWIIVRWLGGLGVEWHDRFRRCVVRST